MAYSLSDRRMAAQKLASMHPALNPALNSTALAHIPAQSLPLVKETLNDPTTAAIAAASTHPAATSTSLNPKMSRQRVPGVRHQVCAFAQVALAAATSVGISAIPYQPFRATRAVFAPATIASNDALSAVSNWQVGTSPMFTSLDAEPLSNFASGNQASYLTNFDECEPSIAISAQVKSPNTTTFWGCLFGASRGQAVDDLPANVKVSRLPIKSTVIAAGSTINVTATTTRAFWGRKIILAEAGVNTYGDTVNVTAGANGASGLLLQQLYVGNTPQFVSAPTSTSNLYVPCAAFMGLYDEWIELSRADISVPYVFQVYNPGTVSLNFTGVIEGDVAA